MAERVKILTGQLVVAALCVGGWLLVVIAGLVSDWILQTPRGEGGNAMTEVEKRKTLEERVREKLHAQIGDLITSEDLRQIVDRGVEEALFKPRETKAGAYSSTTITKQSIVVEMVAELLEKEMQTAVKAWIEENQEQFQELVQEAVGSNGQELALAALATALQPAFQQVIWNLHSSGQLPGGS